VARQPYLSCIFPGSLTGTIKIVVLSRDGVKFEECISWIDSSIRVKRLMSYKTTPKLSIPLCLICLPFPPLRE